MVSYDVEHSLPTNPSRDNNSSTRPQRERPDLSTFYSSLSNVDTSSVNNINSVPTPNDVAASFRLMGEGYQALMADNPHRDRVETMLEQIAMFMENPPERPRGLSQEFIDGLERVPKRVLDKLKQRDGGECPICGEGYLDEEYPLVVRLPCNEKHLFHLECIQPWLKLNSTCPLDRKDMAPKPPESNQRLLEVPKEAEEDEDDYDGMYM